MSILEIIILIALGVSLSIILTVMAIKTFKKKKKGEKEEDDGEEILK